MTRLQVRPLGGFSRTMAQTTRSRARVCQTLKSPKVKILGKNRT